MKLHNKKTRIIGYIEYVMRTINPITGEPLLTVRYKDDSGITCYKDYETIEEFNEEWEDYKPVEPLIQDKEARKIIKDFAERCGIRTFVYCQENLTLRGANTGCYIGFGSAMISFGLIDGKGYYVEELCGEEEE